MSKSYTKKAINIEAIQWTGDNIEEITIFTKGDAEFDMSNILTIDTLEGKHKANINDYIIKGIKGEFYPCKPDIFEASYSPYSEERGNSFIKLNDKYYKSLPEALNYIDNYKEMVGLCSRLELKFQDGVISENGVNGIQFTGLIEIALSVLKNLNSRFPCRENSVTITKLQEALMWQEARTKDREKRAVEGKNEK